MVLLYILNDQAEESAFALRDCWPEAETHENQ
jgi:hypothetical protein